VGVALLWLLVGAIAVIRLRVESRRVTAELARLQTPRQALLAARQTMDSARAMLTALDEASAARGQVAGRLAAIAKALPDSAFLTAITLDRGGPGVLAGRARQAPLVAAALGAAPGVGSLQLEAVTVRDTVAGLGWERFSFRLGWRTVP
jgi:hypothetical protein